MWWACLWRIALTANHRAQPTGKGTFLRLVVLGSIRKLGEHVLIPETAGSIPP